MGLDIYIDKCRKPKLVEQDGKKYRDYEEREEVCYWRKFWEILHIMNYGDDEYGQDVRMTKEDVERILQLVTHHRDYFDSFNSVPQVCELLDTFDEIEDDGWIVNFNANW